MTLLNILLSFFAPLLDFFPAFLLLLLPLLASFFESLPSSFVGVFYGNLTPARTGTES
jgi:hypothetical protein